MKKSKVFILPHQGLGDHIVCAGIYREYAKQFFHCVVPVKKNNFESVRDMLKDCRNIQVISYPSEGLIDYHQMYLAKFGYTILKLGGYGIDFFLDQNLRLDEHFYKQANIPISMRWESFKYIRNHKLELELFDLLECKKGKYIFIHDDINRGFNIDPTRIPAGYRVIRPDPVRFKRYTVFNYLRIIENAYEIHCMESSFAALIESFKIDVPKFAHRYARPEAKSNKVFEFTYRNQWKILL
jgi:hypothetical protein